MIAEHRIDAFSFVRLFLNVSTIRGFGLFLGCKKVWWVQYRIFVFHYLLVIDRSCSSLINQIRSLSCISTFLQQPADNYPSKLYEHKHGDDIYLVLVTIEESNTLILLFPYTQTIPGDVFNTILVTKARRG